MPTPPALEKVVRADAPPPRLLDHERTCSRLSWQAARAEVDGLPGGGVAIPETLDARCGYLVRAASGRERG